MRLMDHPEKYLYCYCIIRSSEARTFEGFSPMGDTNGPVHAVSRDGLAVVVSDSALGEYESTRANMLAHERVVEGVMREFTVLPIRFGTLTQDGTSAIPDILKLLEKRFKEFDKLLADMEGKVELGLKALWRDEKAIFQEILGENAAIRRLRNSLAGKKTAILRYQAVPLGEKVKEELDRKRRGEAARILTPLKRVACRTRENNVVMDRMVFSAAFLVDQSREGEFDQAVTKLDEEWGCRINFKYTGPNPPWNFVDIIVNWEKILERESAAGNT